MSIENCGDGDLPANDRRRFRLAAKPSACWIGTHLHPSGGEGQPEPQPLHGWEIAGAMKRLHAFKLSGAKLPSEELAAKDHQ